MTRFLSFVLLLVLVFAQVFGHEGHDHSGHSHDDDHEPENSDVVVLGEDNFDSTIAGNEFVFVEFYAPWCGHCKHLAPEYERVATTLKSENSPAVVAKVDATVHGQLGQRFAVRGYPTLKFFRNGSPVDYDGQRTAEDIINFIKKKSGPPSSHLTSADAISSFKAAAGTAVIAYLSDAHTSVWSEVGKSGQLDDFAIGHVTDSSLFGDLKAPAVAIYRDKEEVLVYSGDYNKAKIVTWILSEGHPLVSELSQKSWARSQTSEAPLLALFFSAISDSEEQLARNIALKYKGKIVVTTSATTNLAERWGSSGKKFPTAIFVKWAGESPKFVIFDEDNEQLTAETAENFVEKSLSGAYKGYRKSEPIPESNSDPVKVLVGKTFESIVFDANKDVFVEFYAPWCGHCKRLAPIWDELGEAYKDSESVVIAKVDATANSIPSEIEVRGYPTLIFFPADNKSGLPYEGERDLSNMKKFVKEHASVGRTEL